MVSGFLTSFFIPLLQHCHHWCARDPIPDSLKDKILTFLPLTFNYGISCRDKLFISECLTKNDVHVDDLKKITNIFLNFEIAACIKGNISEKDKQNLCDSIRLFWCKEGNLDKKKDIVIWAQRVGDTWNRDQVTELATKLISPLDSFFDCADLLLGIESIPFNHRDEVCYLAIPWLFCVSKGEDIVLILHAIYSIGDSLNRLDICQWNASIFKNFLQDAPQLVHLMKKLEGISCWVRRKKICNAAASTLEIMPISLESTYFVIDLFTRESEKDPEPLADLLKSFFSGMDTGYKVHFLYPQFSKMSQCHLIFFNEYFQWIFLSLATIHERAEVLAAWNQVPSHELKDMMQLVPWLNHILRGSDRAQICRVLSSVKELKDRKSVCNLALEYFPPILFPRLFIDCIEGLSAIELSSRAELLFELKPYLKEPALLESMNGIFLILKAISDEERKYLFPDFLSFFQDKDLNTKMIVLQFIASCQEKASMFALLKKSYGELGKKRVLEAILHAQTFPLDEQSAVFQSLCKECDL
ncbi:MAG: hypothetical protein EBZ47_04680 [Chlamydiae bacterium]|nr:hypothetical protein [Chlamydiota bacterium]